MDSRWRNLIILVIVVVAVYGFWQTISFSPQPIFLADSIDSFEEGDAAITAILQEYDWFEPGTQTIQNANSNELLEAKQKLEALQTQIQQSPLFEDKPALEGLVKAWIARIEVVVAWNALRAHTSQVFFAGTETNAEICVQKNFFVGLENQLTHTIAALKHMDESHNAFVTGFAVLARNNGFARETDSTQEVVALQHQLRAVQNILEACP